jgi:hypothetical protein
MVSRKIKDAIHVIYDNVGEFRGYHPNDNLVEDWRASDEGDWVRTDDGKVCSVLRKGELKRGTSKKTISYVRTAIGSFICKDSISMEGEPRENMYSFGSTDLTTYQHFKNKKQLTAREFLFAKYVVKGDEIADAFMSAFPTNERSYAEYKGKLLVSTDRIKKVIREEVDKVLNDADITPLYLLEGMRSIIDKKDSQDKDKIQALKTLMQISGMMDTEKRTESVTLFQGFTKEQLDVISEGSKRKLVEAKREVEK